MRKVLLTLVVSLLVPALVSAETWATAVSRKGERQIVFRYLKEMDPGNQRSKQTARIIIVWKYTSENGMPAQSERLRMEKLEDSLYPALVPDGFATLALVSTGENWREWVFYVKSEAEFFARSKEALQGQSPYPIEIHAAPDPEWKTYEDFRKNVRE